MATDQLSPRPRKATCFEARPPRDFSRSDRVDRSPHGWTPRGRWPLALLVAAALWALPDAARTQGAGKANLRLSGAAAGFAQASDTTWTLSKTGVLDTTAKTATWTIEALPGTTAFNQLFVNGVVQVTNLGTAGAPIGNIVVNLQTRNGTRWITQSSDIADATSDDAATVARIEDHASSEGLSVFTENGASGALRFMDGRNNSVFSLVPQKIIAPGATVPLLFAAAFENTLLALPVGTPVRVEVIVSFGNSGGNAKNSSVNLDINGNGTLEAYEARVRSVPARLAGKVPAVTPGNATVALSDTLADIVATGDVTFSNAQFVLGATTGTVSASYDGGITGGTLTNCALLTGSSSTTVQVGGYSFPVVNGLHLQACDTLAIEGNGTECPRGAPPGCGWEEGDLSTFSQNDWGGEGGTAATLLSGNSASVYASTAGVVSVGTGNTMTFSNAQNVIAYLPALGLPAALSLDLVNPTSSSSGIYGGDALSLRLNIDFSDAGLMAGASGLSFGDLRICNFPLAALNGVTVRSFMDIVDTSLGGGGGSATPAILDGVTNDLNLAFQAGAPSTFAQDYLVAGPCASWKNGDLRTYNQNNWGHAASAAGSLLATNFDSVYSAFNLEVGIGGSGGFSMTFVLADAVFSYLPAIGVIGPLTFDLVNPTDSSSESFGGEVVALELNVSFSDAGVLAGASSVHLGDLRVCGFTLLPAVNGMSVRQVLATANTVLGGGSAAIDPDEAAAIASLINNSFESGNASSFAQDHLVDGACP